MKMCKTCVHFTKTSKSSGKCACGAPEIYKKLGLIGPAVKKTETCGQHRETS